MTPKKHDSRRSGVDDGPRAPFPGETASSSGARPRILIVKLADLGDALLSTPAIARLRRNLPDARLEVLTTATGAPAFEHSGLVDEVLVFDKRRYDRPATLVSAPSAAWSLGRELRGRRPDAVLVFHPMTTRFGALKHAGLALSTGAAVRAGLARAGISSWRSFFINAEAEDLGFDGGHVVEACERVVDAALRALGVSDPRVDAADRHARFQTRESARREADELLSRLGVERGEPALGPGRASGRWIGIHPGSGAFSLARRWPAPAYSSLIDRLQDRGHRCLVLGRESDDGPAVVAGCRRPPAELIERTPLPLLAAILERLDVLVANDGGVMHLASAVGTPVVAVFGPSNERYWGPWWPGHDRSGSPGPSPHRVVSLDLACRPCFYRGRSLGSKEGCPQRDCLNWLSPGKVALAVEDLVGP